ncbi:hypothetical protein D3C80_1762970 [compost metagenome]
MTLPDVVYRSFEVAALKLCDVILDRQAVEIGTSTAESVVVQQAAFLVIDNLWRGHVKLAVPPLP